MNQLDKIAESRPSWKRHYVDKYQIILVKAMNDMLAQQGMSQHDLAIEAGWKESYVSRILSGEQNITLKSLARFEAALGREVLRIFQPTSDTPSPSLDNNVSILGKSYKLSTFDKKNNIYKIESLRADRLSVKYDQSSSKRLDSPSIVQLPGGSKIPLASFDDLREDESSSSPLAASTKSIKADDSRELTLMFRTKQNNQHIEIWADSRGDVYLSLIDEYRYNV